MLLSLLWLVTTMTASGTEQGNDLKLTLVYDSPYGFEETLESSRNSIHAHNFRVFPGRYLEEGLVDEFSVERDFRAVLNELETVHVALAD